jgi:hypothetical protein
VARRKAGSKGPGGAGGGGASDEKPSEQTAANVEPPIVPQSPGASGSIEVLFSNPRLPLAPDVIDALGEPTDVSRPPTTEASLGAHAAVERPAQEDPFDAHDLTVEPEQTRSSARQVAKRAEVLIGQGVSKIGDGIGSIGEGVSKIGERASRVPVLGQSVKQLGEGISELGASLHDLPAMTRSKRGRVLVRSMLVAFLLVFAWIAGIVLLQLRDSKKPDFRPLARKILIAVRDGREAAVWADASPRFQEVVREQRFIDDMADMKRTLGAFREIAAVNETIVTSSSSGRIGRVTLMLQFDKGRARGNISFHRDDRRWKLLGIAVDAPPELPITQESRKERSELPQEVMGAAIKVLQAGNLEKARADEGSGVRRRDQRTPRDSTPSPAEAALALALALDRRSEEVWDQASGVFHSSAPKAEFVRLQRERNATLGNFVRVIEHRGGSKKYGDLSATFTGLVEYETGVVTAALNFGRTDEGAPWLLNSFKVVLPMPRPNEVPPGDAARLREEDEAEERPRGGRDSRDRDRDRDDGDGSGNSGGATSERPHSEGPAPGLGSSGGSGAAPAVPTPAPPAPIPGDSPATPPPPATEPVAPASAGSAAPAAPAAPSSPAAPPS